MTEPTGREHRRNRANKADPIGLTDEEERKLKDPDDDLEKVVVEDQGAEYAYEATEKGLEQGSNA